MTMIKQHNATIDAIFTVNEPEFKPCVTTVEPIGTVKWSKNYEKCGRIFSKKVSINSLYPFLIGNALERNIIKTNCPDISGVLLKKSFKGIPRDFINVFYGIANNEKSIIKFDTDVRQYIAEETKIISDMVIECVGEHLVYYNVDHFFVDITYASEYDMGMMILKWKMMMMERYKSAMCNRFDVKDEYFEPKYMRKPENCYI